jgi:hypothetical protein
MSKKNHDHHNSKVFLFAISATVLMGSFILGSQFVQHSMAQDPSQMGRDMGLNEIGNQTANQSAGLATHQSSVYQANLQINDL